MRRAILALIVIAGLLLAGCGPAVMPVATESEAGEEFLIALPRITIAFDENGVPGLEGFPVESIARALGLNLDLSAYRLDPAYVNWMRLAGVQHIEVRHRGEGLVLLVNGKLMPHIEWHDGSLEAAGGFVRLLGPQYGQLAGLLEKVAPLVKGLGLAIVLKFPLQEGAAPLELATDEVAEAKAVAPEGASGAIMRFEVKYDDQGVPSIMGVSARDLALAGVNAPLALAPYAIEQAQANDIQYLQLRSKGDGLAIYINGLPLPAVVWDREMLANLLEVAQRLYAHLPIDWNAVSALVPVLSGADVSILLHMPLAAGAEPLEIKSY